MVVTDGLCERREGEVGTAKNIANNNTSLILIWISWSMFSLGAKCLHDPSSAEVELNVQSAANCGPVLAIIHVIARRPGRTLITQLMTCETGGQRDCSGSSGERKIKVLTSVQTGSAVDELCHW